MVAAMIFGKRYGTLILALILCPCWALYGCATTEAPRTEQPQATASRFEYARVVMGSRARVVLYAPSEAVAAEAARAAFDEMDRINRVLSDYTDKSEAMRLCAAPSGVAHPISPDLLDVMIKSAAVHQASGGAFDPALGALTKLWRSSFRSGRLPDQGDLRLARAASGLDLIHIDQTSSTTTIGSPGLILDFGGIGKGYAAGRALRVLEAHGLAHAMVDLGGDLALGAPPPGAEGWKVEITDDRSGQARVLRLSNRSVATSGDAYRSVTIDGVRYSHILDPATGLGLTSSHGVTVIADEAWLADALASAASVLGPDGSAVLTKRWAGVELIWHAPSSERVHARE